MTTFLSSISGVDMSASTNFATLMGTIAAQIAGFGWVKTADTGQIDPSAASYPGTGSDTGYEIYRTDDGKTDIYMKIVYGMSGGATQPRLKIGFGTGTDGAGTLTGNATAVNTIDLANAQTSPVLAMSGTAGRIMILYGEFNSNGGSMGVSAGRALDNTGAETNDFEAFWLGTTNRGKQQAIPQSGTIMPVEGDGFQVILRRSADTSLGTKTMTGHPVNWSEAGAYGPTLCIALVGSSNVSVGVSTTFAPTVHGAAHTFMLVANFVTAVVINGGAATGFRYE